jgi:hypothetical protein
MAHAAGDPETIRSDALRHNRNAAHEEVAILHQSLQEDRLIDRAPSAVGCCAMICPAMRVSAQHLGTRQFKRYLSPEWRCRLLEASRLKSAFLANITTSLAR